MCAQRILLPMCSMPVNAFLSTSAGTCCYGRVTALVEKSDPSILVLRTFTTRVQRAPDAGTLKAYNR